MKRCPKCLSTYTDDSLAFCLQDGAALVQVASDRDSSNSPTQPPPTEIMDVGNVNTTPSPIQAKTIPHGQRATRSEAGSDLRRDPYVSQPRAKSTHSAALIAGITAVVVLLFVLVGIGIALLLRDQTGGRQDTGQTASQTNSSSKPSTESPNANALRSPSPSPDKTISPPASRISFQVVEGKIVNGVLLSREDLTSLSVPQLRILRNTVFARHGYPFQQPDMQRYFRTKPWYQPRYDFDNSNLTSSDRANLRLIEELER